jgi:hypothetical protein
MYKNNMFSNNNMKDDDIKLVIKTRKEFQEKLNIIFKKYFGTFMKNMYTDSLRDFQKQLFKIPSWSDDKIDKEFKYFIKTINKKYDITEDDISKIFDMIFGLHIKTMTNLFEPIEVSVPQFKIFWYKCLRRIAKFLYENPSLIKIQNNDQIYLGIDESIKYVIHKFIPFKDIINTSPPVIYKYDFNNITNDTNENENDLQIHKIDEDSNELKYIDSDEYYHSDKEKEIEKKEEKERSLNENEEKCIKIPKKKNYYKFKHFNKPKVNSM